MIDMKIVVILLALVAGIWGLLIGRRHRATDTKSQKIWFWGTITLLFAIAIGEGYNEYEEYKEERAKAQVGEIGTKESSRDDWVVDFGGTGTLISGFDFSKYLGDDCSIEFPDGRPLIDCEIRDADGKLIAEISDNEWKTNPCQFFDRNYGDNGFEVRSLRGEVVFQVQIVENRVNFGAKLFGKNGELLYVGNTANINFTRKDGTPHDGAVIVKGPKALPIMMSPLFKYPSELHFGEFVEDES